MRKLLALSCAAAVAATGFLAATAPTSAGVAPFDLELDKSTAGRGETVTVSSVDECISEDGVGAVTVSFGLPDGTSVDAPVTPDETGAWTMYWIVEELEPAGEYDVTATCDLPGSTPDAHYDTESFTVTEYPAVVEDLQFAITPEAPATTTPGGAVNLRSQDACPTHGVGRFVQWAIFSVVIDGDDVYIGDLLEYGDGVLAEDGTWTASFAAPQTEGLYAVDAGCGRTGLDQGETVYEPTGWYVPLPLLVGPNAPTPPGPLPDNNDVPGPPANPKPAPGVAGRPGFTG